MKLLAPRIWILSAATLAVAACVAPVPQPENMEVGIPDQLPVLGTSNTDAPQLNPSDHWQQFFTDPQLKHLIQQGLDFNSDLKAAIAQVA